MGEYSCNPASRLCIRKSEVCNGVPDCYEEVEEAECSRCILVTHNEIKVPKVSENLLIKFFFKKREKQNFCAKIFRSMFGNVIIHVPYTRLSYTNGTCAQNKLHVLCENHEKILISR